MKRAVTEDRPQPPRPDLRRFRRELTPTWIAAALVCDGQGLPRWDRPTVVYLDGSSRLGGFTAPVVAACQPDAQVLAWSPFPSALSAASDLSRDLDRAAGLDNLVVHESAEPPMPTEPIADLVIVDGILDSVDDEYRSRLLDSVNALLRPGGVACVHYRTTVGWSELAPVLRLVRHVVSLDPRDPLDALPDALDLVVELRAGGAAYLTQRPAVTAWLDELVAMPTADAVAAYLDLDLRPLSQAQLRSAMGSIGCEYVGSAQVGDALGIDQPEGTRELTASLPAAVLRESFEDLATRRSHRTDLFQLGPTSPSESEHKRDLASLTVLGLPQPSSDHDGAPTSMGPSAEHIPKSVRKALSEGAVTLADLEPDPSARAGLLRRLMAAGLAHPVAAGDDGGADPRKDARRAVARLNKVLGRAPVPERDRLIASQIIGSAVAASPRPTKSDLARMGVR